jgi:hypothetical protein
MRKFSLLLITLILLLGLSGVFVVFGYSPSLSVPRQVLAEGGGPAASRNVSLNGTFGQPFSGQSLGSQVRLGSGYWYGSNPNRVTLYLPIVKSAP